MSFENLGLPQPLLDAVSALGFASATEVQARAIPLGLQGRDLMVSSRTGSGKTAAFLLPMLTRVLAHRAANPGVVPAFVPRFGGPRGGSRGGRSFGKDQRGTRGAARQQAEPFHAEGLVLAPTRELALQVAQMAQQLGKGIDCFTVCTVVGGMPYPAQLQRLRAGADLIIATPGRLLDIAGQMPGLLSQIKTCVLDEADRMLDLGFIEDIEAIAQMLPKPRQTVMFSATFDGKVGGLARELLDSPERIEVVSAPEQKAQIEQRLHWADHPLHRHALLEHLLADAGVDQAVVFAGTQIEAEEMAGQLAELGHAVAALHGGMPQGKRNRTLMGLRRRELRVLVATDVAARGIDVPTISHVINLGLPMKAEDYVHRIGRTGRAGRTGLAVTLALREDLPRLRRLQAYTKEALAPSRIEGLEPKKPDPVVFTDRPVRPFEDRGPRRSEGYGQRGPRDQGRPGYGHSRQGGDERAPFGAKRFDERRPFDDRRPFDKPGFDKPGFDKRPFEKRPYEPRGDAPRGFEGRPANRFDKPAFEKRPFEGRSFEGRPFEKRGFDKPAYDKRPFDARPGAPRPGLRNDRPPVERSWDERASGAAPAGFDRQGPRADRGFDKGFERKPAGHAPARRAGGFAAPGGHAPRTPRPRDE